MRIRYADADQGIPSFVFTDGIKIIHQPSGVQLQHCLRANAEEGWVDRVRQDGVEEYERIECPVDIIADDKFAKDKALADIMAGVYFEHDLSDDERIKKERAIMGSLDEVDQAIVDREVESYRDYVKRITGKTPSTCSPLTNLKTKVEFDDWCPDGEVIKRLLKDGHHFDAAAIGQAMTTPLITGELNSFTGMQITDDEDESEPVKAMSMTQAIQQDPRPWIDNSNARYPPMKVRTSPNGPWMLASEMELTANGPITKHVHYDLGDNLYLPISCAQGLTLTIEDDGVDGRTLEITGQADQVDRYVRQLDCELKYDYKPEPAETIEPLPESASGYAITQKIDEVVNALNDVLAGRKSA